MIGRQWWSVRDVGGPVLSLVGQVITHAVALATDVDDGGVMNQAVDDRSRNDHTIEDLPPIEKPRLEVRTMGADFS